MALFNLNAAPAAGAGRPRRGLLRALTEDVAPALVAVGGSTIVTSYSALGATESQPVPSRRALIWAAMSGGMTTIFAGIWVARGGPRRHDIGLLILTAAFVPFIYSVSVGDFNPELLATIFNALAEH